MKDKDAQGQIDYIYDKLTTIVEDLCKEGIHPRIITTTQAIVLRRFAIMWMDEDLEAIKAILIKLIEHNFEKQFNNEKNEDKENG